MLIKADPCRIKTQLETLRTFDSRPDQPGTTRALFTDAEIKARDYVKGLMREVGLTVSEDSIGNIFGTLEGTEPELSPVWSGSHIDTVLNAGMYDGMAGVIGAIEACRMIKESGAEHRRSIKAIVFTSEEPTRFGTGCIGSRAMAGHLSLEETKELKDDDGISLYDELVRLGYDLSAYDNVRKHTGDVFASLEMHIEQAPVLEQLGLPIGIVEGICAPTYIHCCITGEQKHAGSTPMNARKDPVCAAAQVAIELERLARSYGRTNTVATIGKMNVFPNASNVIAGNVTFTIDIRDIDQEIKDTITKEICEYMDYLSSSRGIKAEYSVTTNDLPRRSSPKMTELLETTCKELDIPYNKMVSGAYHDSLLVAEFAPMAMIFVPSKGGISHDPSEYTSIEDIALGTDVLANSLLKLANMSKIREN